MTHYSSYSDDTLVELALLGEEAAYEELVRRYENSVIGTAWKITDNRFSAQDASQDAFDFKYFRFLSCVSVFSTSVNMKFC